MRYQGTSFFKPFFFLLVDSWLESFGAARVGCSACWVEPLTAALAFAGVAFALLAADELEESPALDAAAVAVGAAVPGAAGSAAGALPLAAG